MNDWCKVHHHKSGLTDSVKSATLSIPEGEKKLIEMVSKHVIPKCSPLAGNTVYMDKIFLMKYMPKFVDLLHYRIIDVSSIKELATRWYEVVPQKKLAHRAFDDILESIQELQHYRCTIFKTPMEK
eukprot:TRINITY_DN4132_c0_g2_i3.p1 TRINITY_DN4132_c0_g2~~TRINITY_DN4132_c0_g2_i3.p1  ORF type:complete len:126 (-),score=13.14 TRINITY_DN4132_c0_g2_i3:172-549(-)